MRIVQTARMNAGTTVYAQAELRNVLFIGSLKIMLNSL